MADWNHYHQQFAGALKARLVEFESRAKLTREAAALMTALMTLIDNLPYYGNPEWTSCHRGALGNLLQINLSNGPITPKPSETSGGAAIARTYAGTFSGYRDAFFHGVVQSPTAQRVASLVQGVNGGLNGDWWGRYSVAVLTDAVHKTISIPIDASKLNAALANYQKDFAPAVAASCLAVLATGFTPTATPLNVILSAGNGPAAATALSSDIQAGQFTAAINKAIGDGGDGAVAAVWFLFNLRIALKALGAVDVDAIIKQAQSAGLTVPSEVGPGNWWNGGYTAWYTPLSGPDVANAASGTIKAAMPGQYIYVSSFMGGAGTTGPRSETIPNGYAQSLCLWGPLNLYKS